MENKFTWQEKILRLKKIEFSVWIINTVCLKVKNKNKAALENIFFLLDSSPLALLSLFIILLNIISSFTFFILYCSKSEKLYIQELKWGTLAVWPDPPAPVLQFASVNPITRTRSHKSHCPPSPGSGSVNDSMISSSMGEIRANADSIYCNSIENFYFSL